MKLLRILAVGILPSYFLLGFQSDPIIAYRRKDYQQARTDVMYFHVLDALCAKCAYPDPKNRSMWPDAQNRAMILSEDLIEGKAGSSIRQSHIVRKAADKKLDDHAAHGDGKIRR